MPHELLMSYVAAQKRWTKWYRGKTYSVSCKQLGCPASKEGSRAAANQWWESKQAEIDAAAQPEKEALPRPGTPEAQLALLGKWLGRPVENELEATAAFLEIMQHNPPEIFYQAFLGPEKVGQLRTAVDNAIEQPADQHRTVVAQVDSWLNVLRVSIRPGGIDVSRWETYSRAIAIFRDWIGKDSPIDAITAPKLEEYWAWLSLQVQEKRYSSSYAKGLLMTAKQFINRLGELGLIPLPGNIRAKRLKIPDSPKAVETLALEEVQTLLTGCDGFSERTKLYILLMCNCGMLQSDISDLGQDEVDWKEGIVKRPRSKTPNGPVVRYKLWPETFDLLKQFRAKEKVDNERGGHRAVLTERGKPLVAYYLEDGKMRRYDAVQTLFSRLAEKTKIKRALKLFRKTSATLLSKHPQYKFYAQYFLAHSPRSVAERHYIVPSDEEFFAALDWLREQFGLGTQS